MQKLTPTGLVGGLDFGGSVAASGSRIAVSDISDAARGTQSGAVFLFELEGNQWVQTAKITSDTGGATEWYGSTLALTDGELFVGAQRDSDFGSISGSVHVYEFDEQGAPQLKQQLSMPMPIANAYFGSALAIEENTLVAGASQRLGGSYFGTGRSFVFQRNEAGDWEFEQELIAGGLNVGDVFNTATISNGRIAVSAPRADIFGDTAGAVFIFEKLENGWEQVDVVGSPNPDFELDGIAFDGDSLLVGEIHSDSLAADAGAFHSFVRSPSGEWTFEATTNAPDGQAGDRFGGPIKAHSGLAVVAARADDDNGLDAGSVYLLSRSSDDTWSQIAKVTRPEGGAGGAFGSDIAFDGKRIVIGASRSNAAYVYEIVSLPGDFNRDGFIDAADFTVWRDHFGDIVEPYSFADANGDGFIQQLDYQIWKQGFQSGSAIALSIVEPVPEPSTIRAAVIAFVSLCLFRQQLGCDPRSAAGVR
ncbi:dockerin type I domain-containing protein [Pirellulimonas nuda]|uniref:dockerin type I domain-containing protein n=1 Tax=Pirellulimonas nuda TaxID=2528009 RepID=UPI0018D48429|nr:dockerin type I domain-containing protein [Pirellulimonas nuda]